MDKDNKSRCCGYAKPYGDVDRCCITMKDCNPSIACILLLNEQNDILTDKLISIKRYINNKIKYQSARIKNEVFEEHYRRETIMVNLKQVKSYINKTITGREEGRNA